jgi:hypothetical protein
MLAPILKEQVEFLARRHVLAPDRASSRMRRPKASVGSR